VSCEAGGGSTLAEEVEVWMEVGLGKEAIVKDVEQAC